MDLRTREGKQELGKRIHSAIAAAGYDSLPEFAQELGCSRALIYQYVNGDVLVQLDRLQAIAELTNRPLSGFFTDRKEAADTQKQLERARAEIESLRSALAQEQSGRLNRSDTHRAALLELLEDLANAQRRAGDVTGMLETCARWLELAKQADEPAGANRARLQLGHAWYRTGEYVRAAALLREVLANAGDESTSPTVQSARQELVRVLQAQGHIEGAREQATITAGSESWWSKWAGTLSLAALAEQTGDLEDVQGLLAQAQAIIENSQQPPDRIVTARTYLVSNECNLCLARGEYYDAADCARKLHSLAAESGIPEQVREAVLNLGIAHMHLGNMKEAGERLDRLHEWAQMSGDGRLLALAKIFKSEHARHMRDFDRSRELALQGLQAAGDTDRPAVLSWALLNMGRDYLQAGQTSDARHHLERCRRLSQELSLRRPELAATIHAATITADTDTLETAARQCEDTGYHDLSAAARVLLAKHLSDSRSFTMVEEARERCREIGDFWGEATARARLVDLYLHTGQLSTATAELVQLVARKGTQLDQRDNRSAFSIEQSLACRIGEEYRRRGQEDKAAVIERTFSQHEAEIDHRGQ